MAYDEFDGMSWWLYAPNKVVAISFTIAFSITMSVHMWQAIRYKTYFNSCIFAVCGFTYAAGFALRAWAAFDNYAGLDNLIPFVCSVCLIAITPPLLALVDYHIFGQVLYYVPYLSPIHPGRVVWLFGIVSWVIEGLNGTGASYAANPHANSMIGHIMMRASYALQLIINATFLALVLFFHRRCVKAGLAGVRSVKYTLASIYASIALILVRTVYRTVEHYAMEELDGKEIRGSADIPVMVRYEVFFCVFDAALMLVNLVLWNVMHTSRYLPADNKTYIARDGATEVKGLGWQDGRSRSSRMMDPFDLMGMCGRRKREKASWSACEDQL
ncbi:Lipid-translocating exporter-like protein RTA1 like [Verticillium longisporum]|uniref:Lipid-translocating exporter-like protein RTA1 like n=1 Tax=Verticillium longisporum TaxID=100787 RepID=A0A8I2ZN60_VERLO|nr:Lipid-translocating exporter-like protein RTA1 like [Verticillium longisporum]KAG7135043.1 Lipid-translocating exporter-like protein RTA1 like [Verticillium longisporum]KAG7145153.1 Lipid-translocating exporter-like protein RTA1 like [Verticillium longisporum]